MVKSQVFDVIGDSSVGSEWGTFKSALDIPSVVENIRILSSNRDVALPDSNSFDGVSTFCWNLCGYRMLERPRSIAFVPHNTVAMSISKVANQKIFSAAEKLNSKFVAHTVGGRIACVFKNCLKKVFHL